MSVAVRDKPKLWAEIKNKWHRGSKGGVAGKWNARKAMLAVQEYKRRGGGYIGRRSPSNSLKKWELEKWDYIDNDPTGRYLPESVRRRMTPAEKRRENSLKRGRLGEWVPYSKSVNAKMQKAGVYSRRRAAAKTAVVRRTTTKKTAVRRTATKRPAVKRAPKKAPTKKAVARRTAAKKTAVRRTTTKKAPAKKAAVRRTTTKKTVVRRTGPKKTAAKTTVTRR